MFKQKEACLPTGRLKRIFILTVLCFSFFSALHVSALTLGITGNKFTVDNQAKFLTLISYFDATRASDATLNSDFDYLKSKGIDGIRILPNWWGVYNNPYSVSNPPPDTLIDINGNLRSSQLTKLKNVIDKANSKNLVVDVSFAREVVPGLSVSNYKKGVAAAVAALAGKNNVFYDLQNEYNCNELTSAHVKEIRDAIKSQASSAIVSASNACGASPSEAVGITNSAGLDIINYHDPRESDWFSRTRDVIKSIAPASKPIYLGEPATIRDYPNLTAANFTTAVTQAKAAGAAAWTFHNRAGFDLKNSTIQANLNTSNEKNFINSFKAQLDATTWGTGSSPQSPNGGSGDQCPVSGKYAGDLRSAMNAVLAANPTLANSPTSEANGIAFLALVAQNPPPGFLVVDKVYNGSPTPRANTWDLLAIRKPGDIKMERYDVLAGGSGFGSMTMSAAVQTEFVGLIALDCVAGGAATNCRCVNETGTGGGNPGSGGGGNVTPPAVPPSDDVTVESQKNLGEGTHPDVAIYQGKIWMAVQQGANLNIYKSSLNLSDIKIEKEIPFGVTGGLAFPKLTVYKDNLWLAYRDNKDELPKLWNLKSGTIEILDSNKTGGNDPVVVGNGSVAWQKVDANFSIMLRELDKPKGSEKNVGSGRGTGLSRILEDGSVTLVDVERKIIPAGTRPSFAEPLAVVEGPKGGALVVKTEDNSIQITLFSGQISFTPRIATDGKGNYVVATWGSAGAGVRIASLKGPINENQDDTPGHGDPFSPSVTLPIPDQGLPTDLGQLIEAIFAWSLSLIGIVIFIRFFYAGFLWFTSAGSTDKSGEAKKIMTNAVYGAVILFSAYLILNTINPDFVSSTFLLPGLPAGQTTSDTDRPNCDVPGIATKYDATVKDTEDFVFTQHPELGSLPNTSENIVKFMGYIVTELKNRNLNAGRVKKCGGTDPGSDAIMVGIPADPYGEVCDITRGTDAGETKTLKEVAQAICSEHSDWNRLISN